MKQLWHGGTIYTMEKEHKTVEAVLVENGRIIGAGPLDSLTKAAHQKVNLHGAVMYPGFVDSHLHMIAYGEKIRQLDLSHATSTEEMLDFIQAAARDTPSNQWLLGVGWNENNFLDKRIPTMEELDTIRKEPIFLTRICRHVSLSNSSAFKFANITASQPSPQGGRIGFDKNGNLNGLLYDQATNLITDTFTKVGQAYIEMITKDLNMAIDTMLANGLTGGHTEDMHYFGEFTNPLTAFKQTIGKQHHFRVNLLRHHEVFQDMMESGTTYDAPFIEPGAMKIFADGAFGGSTAALSKPYADDPHNNGLLLYTDNELEALIQHARKYGEAVAVHMIGDAAVEQTLNIIEKHPAPKGKRDRFIHCSVLRDDLINRIAKLPIVVDAQPAFVPSDFPWVEKRLGSKRLPHTYPWKTLMKQGIMCASGTDAPIENINPLENIYAAVERKSPGDQHQGFIKDQKISRFQAIRMYTYGSAQAICKEHERGLIKQGYVADFTIFDRDLFSGTSEDMLTAKTVKTVVDGKVVYGG